MLMLSRLLPVMLLVAVLFPQIETFSSTSETVAHGGRLDSKGCHTNRKTGEYHCHRPRP